MRLKQIVRLFLPPMYYKVKKHLFHKPESERHPLRKIERNGDKMIIIGNGPSLNKTMDVYGDIILNSPCMMVNFSAKTKMFEWVRPSTYLLVDPVYIDIPDNFMSSMKELCDAIVQKTQWQMSIVMPRKAEGKYMAERFKKNGNLRLLFYEDEWERPEDISKLQAWDNNLFNPPAQTVLNTAVWLSIYWGYQETYLVGADTSWLEDTYVDQKDNRVYTVDSHFFNNEDAYKNESLWTDGKQYIPTKYHEEIETLVVALASYWELREYADWKGVKVYNASEYSCIDAFERKKLK